MNRLTALFAAIALSAGAIALPVHASDVEPYRGSGRHEVPTPYRGSGR